MVNAVEAKAECARIDTADGPIAARLLVAADGLHFLCAGPPASKHPPVRDGVRSCANITKCSRGPISSKSILTPKARHSPRPFLINRRGQFRLGERGF